MNTTETNFHHCHGLGEFHKDFVLESLSQDKGFVAKTVVIPDTLQSLPNDLIGPICGDAPVEDSRHMVRKGREWLDRVVVAEGRPSRLLTIVAVVSDTTIDVYTCHGGPLAERNPYEMVQAYFDGKVTKEAMETSIEFWKVHALAVNLT